MAARLDRAGLTPVVPETLLILSLLLPVVCLFCLQAVVAQGQGKIEEIRCSSVISLHDHGCLVMVFAAELLQN